MDPFKLMSDEDPDGTKIASILAQEGVSALYSGSLIVERNGCLLIQGVEGYGDEFMLGRAIDDLPEIILGAVRDLYQQAANALGPVRFEWVYDGSAVWLVQLHQGATTSLGNTIYPGGASVFHRFDVAKGIEALRALIAHTNADEGIVLVGKAGITSHLGDLLRKARIPSRIED
jgi:hypothetical protein